MNEGKTENGKLNLAEEITESAISDVSKFSFKNPEIRLKQK